MNTIPLCRIWFGRGVLLLSTVYEIRYGKDKAGTVQVLREGLYYRFVCRCRLPADVVCRLAVRCADKQENLGVMVPVGDCFGLDKRIPVKRLGEGEMEFFLGPRHDQINGRFVPIYPEEPFTYIARLKDAFFVRQNGQAGVVLKE